MDMNGLPMPPHRLIFSQDGATAPRKLFRPLLDKYGAIRDRFFIKIIPRDLRTKIPVFFRIFPLLGCPCAGPCLGSLLVSSHLGQHKSSFSSGVGKMGTCIFYGTFP